jgi:hypothetical protein
MFIKLALFRMEEKLKGSGERNVALRYLLGSDSLTRLGRYLMVLSVCEVFRKKKYDNMLS